MDPFTLAGGRSVPPANGSVVQIVKLAMGTGNPGAAPSSADGASPPPADVGSEGVTGTAVTGSPGVTVDRESAAISGLSTATSGRRTATAGFMGPPAAVLLAALAVVFGAGLLGCSVILAAVLAGVLVAVLAGVFAAAFGFAFAADGLPVPLLAGGRLASARFCVLPPGRRWAVAPVTLLGFLGFAGPFAAAARLGATLRAVFF
jgi:hypothetical protein